MSEVIKSKFILGDIITPRVTNPGTKFGIHQIRSEKGDGMHNNYQKIIIEGDPVLRDLIVELLNENLIKRGTKL